MSVSWILLGDQWIAEVEQVSVTVRWSRGAWHWRAVFCEGPAETAQFAGDNRQEYPNGFIDAESARQSAEKWLKRLTQESS
ncbi:MAG: hypothetical protein OHK0023_23060 [Anaerolineae bacterium]